MLASSYFHEPRYLAAAQKYYDEYVRKGILNAAAGEILSAPDSEAAFNTLESFVWLYEITGGVPPDRAALRGDGTKH